MAEWPIAPVLRTGPRKGFLGSNPSPTVAGVSRPLPRAWPHRSRTNGLAGPIYDVQPCDRPKPEDRRSGSCTLADGTTDGRRDALAESERAGLATRRAMAHHVTSCASWNSSSESQSRSQSS